jgi:hypothetical protein
MLHIRNEAIQAEVDAPVNVRRRRWLVRHHHGLQINVAISSASRSGFSAPMISTALRTHFITDESGPAGDEPTDLVVAAERAASPGHRSP